MIIFKKADQLAEHLERERKEGKKIGFVPTMGALHQGHITLLRESKKYDDLTLCSIFINPTQFNNPEDFRLYPVTIEKDIELLIESECTVLFLPSVEEIYNSAYKIRHYDLGRLETILEGFYRPGHFQGVCQVVERLLSIVHPHHLYMGQKDFQQCMVISRLLQIMKADHQIDLRIVPTVRETDGLAMSSRNLRLDASQRTQAIEIFRQLTFIKDHLNNEDFEQLKIQVINALTDKGFKVDYVEILNAQDLSAPGTKNGQLVALVAAYIENVRLIDNLILN